MGVMVTFKQFRKKLTEESFLVAYWLRCLPLDPRFMGSDPAMDDGLLRVIIHKIASFGWKVKQSAPCCKILQYVKDPCGV
jgi:hypothetical protein